MKKQGALAVISALREVRRGAGDTRPLGVAGARELVPLLARELRKDGEPGAVVEGQLERIAALIWIGEGDEAQLRAAWKAGVPIVAVTEARSLPYVLPADLVHVPPGQGFPIDKIAESVAVKLGDNGTSLAARLPVLRPAVCRQLIAAASKRNALISAAIFIPGVDMPVLTLNQARLVLRIALAYGQEVDRQRAGELLGVVGAGFGFRAVARELLDLIPVAGWVVKGGVAYAGTKAVGEAAVRYFEARQ